MLPEPSGTPAQCQPLPKLPAPLALTGSQEAGDPCYCLEPGSQGQALLWAPRFSFRYTFPVHLTGKEIPKSRRQREALNVLFLLSFHSFMKGTNEPFQKARWGSRASSHHGQFCQSCVPRPVFISPCLFLPVQTLCRFESAAPWPKSLYKLFVHVNSWHHPHVPHQCHLRAAEVGAACPDATLQRCPAAPRNSHGKGSAQTALLCPWGLADRGDLGTPLWLWYRSVPLPAPALPLGSWGSQPRHGTCHPWSRLGTCHPWSHPGACQPGAYLRTCPPWSHPVPARLGCDFCPLPCWAHPQSRLASQTPPRLSPPKALAAGTWYFWDIFVQHPHRKSFSVKLLIAFGSLNQTRAPRTFSRDGCGGSAVQEQICGSGRDFKDTCLSCPSRLTVCRQPSVQNKDRVLRNSYIISFLLRRPLPPAAVSE